ncbi:PQQ-dependent sugar dehydrogenase [Sphingomonas quercus]|uniref:PQQ-dependent sugar dehydrogenase n=1 Tax=Sphingomonas quercus TaxID=2842451 RepID=A0ABS6BHG7_9SPHN|nr:PQQ-dependent sugar dehydrogenase [Sphingomonas quercus]MBU3077246.1 PQQ-dependent sugar dehydrogenase [Sphingomonas quercus]
MGIRRFRLATLLLACATGVGEAAVVVNPIPPIQPGLSVGIEKFTNVPASQLNLARTGAQGLKAVDDGSGRLFIPDSRGVLYVTTTAGGTPTPYLDLRAQNIGFSNAADPTQTGLMSVAFHPNFGKDPQKPGYNIFYTIDTTAAGAGQSDWPSGASPASHDDVVREWTVADPTASTAQILSQREVMRAAQPERDHGPGTIAFNPAATEGSADYGKLYIGLGDGGGVNDPLNNAQNLQTPFGKILRIDPTDPDGAGPLSYGTPADNPLVGDVGARGEVWAYGLRNPQHFSWDESGRMIIADIGQEQIDEVNIGMAGANYGWPLREGTFAHSPDKGDTNIYDSPANGGLYVDPIGQYDHEEIQRDGLSRLASIGGAFVYEGDLVPALDGMILLSDLVSGRLFYFDPADAIGGPAMLRELLLTMDGLAVTLRDLEGYGGQRRVDLRLGVDADGEIYMITKGDGAIYRFAANGVPEPATWLSMILGLGLAGAALRRRQRRVRLA